MQNNNDKKELELSVWDYYQTLAHVIVYHHYYINQRFIRSKTAL